MSILNVNQIQPVGSGQTVTISAANITASSATITANTFSGALSSSGISTFSDTVNVGAGKSIRLYGATSGYSDIIAAAGSASTTFTLPANGGTSGQYLQTDGSGALSWQTVAESAEWVDGTAVSPTGTSSVTFSSIPSNAQAIFISFDGLSWATTGGYLGIRLGTGGSDETTGYISKTSYLAAPSTISIGGDTDQFRVRIWQDAGTHVYGNLILINQTGNTWTLNGSLTNSQSDSMNNMAGRKSLSGTLDQITLFQSSGNNFDAGTVNIHYVTT